MTTAGAQVIPQQERLALIAPALLLFVSGAAGLIYQVLWVKQLSLIVGVDVYAITTAVSAFFAGLAIGSILFGRRADRHDRPLLLYAWLELAIAALSVGATLVLAHTAPLFAWMEARAGLMAWVLPFLLVGLPALCMGGTVPVLVRWLAQQTGGMARAGGSLYGANTAGAIVGTMLCAFVLIPWLGVRGSAFAAATLNVAAALAAFLLVKAPHAAPARRHAAEVLRATIEERLALALYAVAGGIALGYEVVWTQAIVQWTSTRSFAFATVLATYLAGLAAGSAWFARRADRTPDPWGTFGLLIAAAGVIALIEIMLLGDWLEPLQVNSATLAFSLTQSEPVAMSARFVVAALCVVFVPTLLLGAAFPAALRLTASLARAGGDSGRVLAFNTAGGILGTLLTGFFLVPAFGLERSLAVMAIAACVVGMIAVLRGTAVTHMARWATIALTAIAILAAVLVPPDHLARLLASARGGTLVFHEASPGGTVAVIEQGPNERRFRRLYVQGVSNSGDSLTSLRYMRLQALLPLMIHRDEPRSVLVIGLGTGITAGSLLRFPGLERRVCAELLAPVARAAPLFRGNYGIVQDSRFEIRTRDGRRELLRDAQRYDLITLEPPPPSSAGVVNLYSTEFYALAAKRLQANGLLAQWLPLPTQTDADTRSLVRSFLDVFPHATLWTTELHETMLIGSLQPIELEVAKIAARFEQPDVASALRAVGIATPAALLATWVTGREGLERYAGGAAAVTDDRPRIEYGPWVLPGEFARTLPNVLAVRTDPPLVGAHTEFAGVLAAHREHLLEFYQASLYAYEGDRQRWAESLTRVMNEEGDNPYFRWIAGAGP